MAPERLRTSRRPSALLLTGALGVAALLAGCGDEATDGGSAGTGDGDAPLVLATTSIWADVVDEVACGEVRVDTVVPLGADAHSYEPTVQDADRVRGASLVVANGLGLEEGLTDTLDLASSDGVPVVELAPEVELLAPADSEEHSEGEDAHSDGDAHSEGEEHAHEEGEEHAHEEGEEHAHEEGEEHAHDGDDPHVWMDPTRVAATVPVIVDALGDLDGVDPETVDGCADGYREELAALDAELEDSFGALPDAERRLVTNHEALGYLADRYDLEVVGTVIPSTSSLGEADARSLEELAATIEDLGITRIYGETTDPAQVAESLANRVGSDVEVVELTTESLGEEGTGTDSYVSMMRANAALITGAGG